MLLALRTTARQFGLLMAVGFLAVLTLGEFGHHCHLAPGNGLGRGARALVISGGREASSPHSCLACLWEQSTVSTGAVPSLTITLSQRAVEPPACPEFAEAALPAPIRSSRAPPAL